MAEDIHVTTSNHILIYALGWHLGRETVMQHLNTCEYSSLMVEGKVQKSADDNKGKVGQIVPKLV